MTGKLHSRPPGDLPHRRWRPCVVVGLLIVLVLGLRGDEDASPRLRYLIVTLGNARDTTVVSPGMGDSEHAVALRYELGMWSRFNWPRFHPTPGIEAVSVGVRAPGEHPATVRIRVLTNDDIEWQSAPQPVGPQWRTIRLEADDFSYFRGATPEAAGTLDLQRSVQFHILPKTEEGAGTAAFWVDNVHFSPTGPQWTAENRELLPPMPPHVAERERIDDVLRRWRVETDRLDREAERTRRWLVELTQLAEAWDRTIQKEAVQERMRQQSFAWQQPPQGPAAQPVDPILTQQAYESYLEDEASTPTRLLDPGETFDLATARLYSAPEQPPPRRVEQDGTSVFRHEIAFSQDAVRQTVFTVLGLPHAMDLSGQRILVRMRLSSPPLDSRYPFLMRLFTEAGGEESWADFRPSVMPGPDWAEVSFDTGDPVRGVRFNPKQTIRLAFRVENEIGQGGRATLELADVRRAPPAATAIVRRRLLRDTRKTLDHSRDILYRLRQKIAILEEELSEHPDLKQAYLASFRLQSHATRGDQDRTATATPIFDPAERARSDQDPQRIHSRTVLVNQWPALALETNPPSENSTLLAELRTPAGRLLAAAREDAPRLLLKSPDVQWWQPGNPATYTLYAAIIKDGQTLARTRRTVGFRTVEVAPGPLDPMLRHIRQTRQPGWTLQLNGQPAFLRMTRYHWPDPDRTLQTGIRLLGDLWVDGLRDYGFSTNRFRRERCNMNGIAKLASFAPSYGPLQSWPDIVPWQHAFSAAGTRIAPAADAPSHVVTQVGNEAELTVWGADLVAAFPDTPYHPLDIAAETLRRTAKVTTPIMYVRAASFRTIPPLPHEDICGINQYTGRYSGRMDNIARDLAELARQAVWADRPLMITEWMGPKYSWVGGGVGGVTRRGAAYYLERYWRAMTATPGIVGSSEFTLNWVIAPFEDLTTQSRQEAWENRPPHHAFGGGSSADHVPIVAPGDAVRGPCFRSMQAFHGPLYTMVRAPGPIVIAGPDAQRLAEALSPCRDDISVRPTVDSIDDATRAHRILLNPVEQIGDAQQPWPEPRFTTRVNPRYPDVLITELAAPDSHARHRGVERLLQSAQALAELDALEGAMPRVLALIDSGRENAYTRYLLEYAARGYLLTGDDVRTKLDKQEFYDANDSIRPAWSSLEAILLDCRRTLEDSELNLVNGWLAEGRHVIVSAPCHAANPGLGGLSEATFSPCGTLYDHYPLINALRTPIPVRDLGGADRSVIEAFRPELADSPALLVYHVEAPGTQPLAMSIAEQPVIVTKTVHDGRLTLIGTSIGDAVEIHRRVTRSGRTHRLYDRDTACGLERLSRTVINLCRYETPETRRRPRLFVTLAPETTVIQQQDPIRTTLRLTDRNGTPQSGHIRARTRVLVHGYAKASGPYVDIVTDKEGHAEIRCAPDANRTGGTHEAGAPLTYALPEGLDEPAIISIQLKAYAIGHVPANAALAVVATPQ